MFIKIERLMDGPGPSDIIVSFRTADGKNEEVVVNQASISGNSLKVALIGYENGRSLIELPRETASGQGRVWVAESDLHQLEAAE